MKTLFLIRHAKSSWDNITLSDFERALNERGKSDAPKMAKRLRKKNIKIDAFISSPAKRAKKTAEYFIKEFNGKGGDIILVSALYDAGLKDFSETIKTLKLLMLFFFKLAYVIKFKIINKTESERTTRHELRPLEALCSVATACHIGDVIQCTEH